MISPFGSNAIHSHDKAITNHNHQCHILTSFSRALTHTYRSELEAHIRIYFSPLPLLLTFMWTFFFSLQHLNTIITRKPNSCSSFVIWDSDNGTEEGKTRWELELEHTVAQKSVFVCLAQKENKKVNRNEKNAQHSAQTHTEGGERERASEHIPFYFHSVHLSQ